MALYGKTREREKRFPASSCPQTTGLGARISDRMVAALIQPVFGTMLLPWRSPAHRRARGQQQRNQRHHHFAGEIVEQADQADDDDGAGQFAAWVEGGDGIQSNGFGMTRAYFNRPVPGRQNHSTGMCCLWCRGTQKMARFIPRRHHRRSNDEFMLFNTAAGSSPTKKIYLSESGSRQACFVISELATYAAVCSPGP